MPADRKPRKKKLTRRQEKLARAIVADPNASLSDVGREAGFAGETKQQLATAAWKSSNLPAVKDRIRELMNQRPATSLEGLHKTLEEGLAAKETKFFATKGVVKSKRVTVDHGTRHRYLETALEMHGALEKDKGAGTTNNYFTKEAMETFVAAFKGQIRPAQQLTPPPPLDPPAPLPTPGDDVHDS